MTSETQVYKSISTVFMGLLHDYESAKSRYDHFGELPSDYMDWPESKRKNWHNATVQAVYKYDEARLALLSYVASLEAVMPQDDKKADPKTGRGKVLVLYTYQGPNYEKVGGYAHKNRYSNLKEVPVTFRIDPLLPDRFIVESDSGLELPDSKDYGWPSKDCFTEISYDEPKE